MKVAVFLALIALTWGAAPAKVEEKGDSSNIEVFAKLEQKKESIKDVKFANLEGQQGHGDGDEVASKMEAELENSEVAQVENSDGAEVENSDGAQVENSDGAQVENSDGAQVQRISKYSCLSTIHILAFTSRVRDGGSDWRHIIEVRVRGHSVYRYLYDRQGDDMLYNKGDLWKYSIRSFSSRSCVRIGDIQRVAIHAGSTDGWNIESIVTMVKDVYGNTQVLTQNLDVYRWIDSDSYSSYKRFYLTFA